MDSLYPSPNLNIKVMALRTATAASETHRPWVPCGFFNLMRKNLTCVNTFKVKCIIKWFPIIERIFVHLLQCGFSIIKKMRKCHFDSFLSFIDIHNCFTFWISKFFISSRSQRTKADRGRTHRRVRAR